jgi:CBS-domain-containing membrane protein
MKALEEIYGLFVEDPWLALLGLIALAVGGLVARAGHHTIGAVLVVLVIGGALAWSVRRA